MQQGIAVESCNFLNDPAFMRPTVLTREHRETVIDRLQTWIKNQNTVAEIPVINTRDPNQSTAQVLQDALSYVKYLETQPDESHRLPDLISYLKTMEHSRRNCVLDYLPEYEELFRSAGY
jgi:hypothetical protein